MRWWATIANKASETAEGVTNRLEWVRQHIPKKTLSTYAKNTARYAEKGALAVPAAIASLITPETNKVMRATANILGRKVIPLLVLQWVNNMQKAYVYGESDEEQNAAFYTVTASFCIDWLVWVYTFREGTELMGQTFILGATAPAAFSAYKAKLPTPRPSPCKDKGCSNKRYLQGLLREPGVFFFNDFLTSEVTDRLPYVGKYLAKVLATFFAGDSISRAANLDRCERDRSTDSEVLFLCGVTYYALTLLMDTALENSIGIPHYFVHRTLRYLIHLSLINIAANMEIPYVAPGKGTLSVDLIVYYEQVTRWVIDALLLHSPTLFKRKTDAEPLLGLSTILQKFTSVLNQDARIKRNDLTFFKAARPPLFRDTQTAVHDPVVRIFWPDLRGVLQLIMGKIRKYAKKSTIAKIANAEIPFIAEAVRSALAEILSLYFGISSETCKELFKWARDEDFWNFAAAIEIWLTRHGLDSVQQLPLAPAIMAGLHQEGEPSVSTTTQDEEKKEEKTPLPSASLISDNTTNQLQTADPGQYTSHKEDSTSLYDTDASFFNSCYEEIQFPTKEELDSSDSLNSLNGMN